MKLGTKHFGEIEIDENRLITFQEGLPGFAALRKFAIFHEAMPDENGSESGEPVYTWLQSVENGDVAFLLLNTFSVMPNYDPKINSDSITSLGEFTVDELLIRNIAVVPENVQDMTVNLKAPIIINPRTMLGKQVVAINEDYKVKHYIMKEQI